MRKFYTLPLLLLAFVDLAIANDTIPATKVTHKFGGRIDFLTYWDNYKNVENFNGVQVKFPSRPEYNSKGENINFQPRLRMSVAPTRFNYTINATNVMGANVKGFIEVDFMGNADNLLGMLRLRHAYIDMQWKTRSLVIGQTSHLSMADEAVLNVVTYGGGMPFNPLNRPLQIQFNQKFGKNSTITLAAAMFNGSVGVEQGNSMVPDFHVRYTGGAADGFSYGATAGVRLLKPRTLTADSSFATKQMVTFDAAVFARYIFGGGYGLRVYGIIGQDISPLTMIGGYATLYSERTIQDYGYAPLSSYSAFVDFETPSYKEHWQLGIFAGYQQNLGSTQQIDLSKLVTSNPGIDRFWRIAPRIYYNYKKHLSFGLEYMFSGASWAKEMDRYYRPVSGSKNAYDDRVTFIARFKF